MPRHNLPRLDESSGLDTRLASGLCAGRAQSKYCMVQKYWLTSVADADKDNIDIIDVAVDSIVFVLMSFLRLLRHQWKCREV